MLFLTGVQSIVFFPPQVLEKSSSGWWFVRRGADEGWVPESFLEMPGKPENQVHLHLMSLHSY